MESTQTWKLNMLFAVRNFKRKNESLAALIPKFSEAFDLLMKTSDELQSLSESQGKERKGVTMDKNILRKSLVDQCLKNSNKLSILSLQKENYTLLKEIQFRESQFTNMKGARVVEKASLIYKNVEAHLAELADQGLDSDTQKVFHSAIMAFNDFLSMPRTAIAERKQMTKKINELFATADRYLKIMDFAVESAKKEHPDFYSNYRAARLIVDTGTRSLALKASAKEMPSGIPLGGVVFIFRSAGTGGEVKKKTTDKGNLQVKSFKPGPWKVFISKDGYKKLETEIIITENKTSELKVELEKG